MDGHLTHARTVSEQQLTIPTASWRLYEWNAFPLWSWKRGNFERGLGKEIMLLYHKYVVEKTNLTEENVFGCWSLEKWLL